MPSFGVAVLTSLTIAAPAGALAAKGLRPVAVINLAGPSGANRASELRAYLVGRGVGMQLPARLRLVLERPSTPAPYRLQLGPARAAYASFAYARADDALEAETSRALTKAPAHLLADTLRDVFVWRGVIAVAQGRSNLANLAEHWFGAALHIAPEHTLDASQYNPRVQEAFERARRKEQHPPTGSLTVSVRPADATVMIDGKPATAGTQTLSLGTHLVVCGHPGHRRAAHLVRLVGQGNAELPVVLTREPAPETAARILVAATRVGAGQPRLTALAPLAQLLGTSRLLVLQQNETGGQSLQLYELARASVSPPLSYGPTDRPTRADELLSRSEPRGLVPVVAQAAAPPTKQAPKTPGSRPWYKRWWVWTAAAVAVVAVGTASVYAATQDEATLVCCE